MSHLTAATLEASRKRRFDAIDKAIESAYYSGEATVTIDAKTVWNETEDPAPNVLAAIAARYTKAGFPTTMVMPPGKRARLDVKLPATPLEPSDQVEEEESEEVTGPREYACTWRSVYDGVRCGAPAKQFGRGAACPTHVCRDCKRRMSASGQRSCAWCRKHKGRAPEEGAEEQEEKNTEEMQVEPVSK
jgi:hypothetical protein